MLKVKNLVSGTAILAQQVKTFHPWPRSLKSCFYGDNLNNVSLGRVRFPAFQNIAAAALWLLILLTSAAHTQEAAKATIPDTPAQVLVKQARVKIAETQLEEAVKLADQALALEAQSTRCDCY